METGTVKPAYEQLTGTLKICSLWTHRLQIFYSTFLQALWELAENLGEVRRVGMDMGDITRLPVHTFQGVTPGAAPAGKDAGSDKTDCLVCMEEFQTGEQLKTLPCLHMYHVNCIDEWLKVGNSYRKKQ